MKLLTILICVLCFGVACHRGAWTSPGVYRPKHPDFKILKEKFVASPLIDTTRLYIASVSYITEFGGIPPEPQPPMYRGLGFYSDGRMIRFYFSGKLPDKFDLENAWAKAYHIGYYTTTGDSIKLESFTSIDKGRYVTEVGLIRQDTIIIAKDYEIINRWRQETFIKSNQYLFR